MDAASRINILFVMMQMEMGGSERLVHTLAQYLDRDRFNPSIAWFHGERIIPEFSDLRIPLHHVPKFRRVDFSAMKAIGALIRENDIDVVNAHHFMSMVYSFYGSKIRNRAKLVYTEHSEWELERLPWRWRKAGARLLRAADAAVGVSGAVANRMRRMFNMKPGKAVSIVNGVRQVPRADGKQLDALREELGISVSDRVIGTVANLKKVKNHLFLLRAYQAVAGNHSNVKLLLVGRGFGNDPDNSEPEIRSFIDSSGLRDKVILTGYRADVPALLGLMDIFCLTSFQEGLPISLIEAMAAGIPVIGTDADGIRDVICPGKNGFLVSISDGTGLESALRALLQNEPLRRAMGRESERLAANVYSFDQCIRSYQDLFSSVAGGKKRGRHDRGAGDCD
jgi:glycosyltransferase involved in cell wall biosynthesis